MKASREKACRPVRCLPTSQSAAPATQRRRLTRGQQARAHCHHHALNGQERVGGGAPRRRSRRAGIGQHSQPPGRAAVQQGSSHEAQAAPAPRVGHHPVGDGGQRGCVGVVAVAVVGGGSSCAVLWPKVMEEGPARCGWHAHHADAQQGARQGQLVRRVLIWRAGQRGRQGRRMKGDHHRQGWQPVGARHSMHGA